jgi:hypothetical protein
VIPPSNGTVPPLGMQNPPAQMSVPGQSVVCMHSSKAPPEQPPASEGATHDDVVPAKQQTVPDWQLAAPPHERPKPTHDPAA